MGFSGAAHSGSKSWWSASQHRHARGGECCLPRLAWRLPMAPAAEGLPALSDGLRLLSKLAVVGDMGTATRQTARGCTGSPWPQSGAERWNYRELDGEDDRKRGRRGYDGSKRTVGRKRHRYGLRRQHGLASYALSRKTIRAPFVELLRRSRWSHISVRSRFSHQQHFLHG